MTIEYRNFEVTVAAGTTKANPQITSLAMPARIVRQITVRVPPGPNGLVGFALGAAGVPVIPFNAGAWIVDNDRTIPLPIAGYHDSGSWQMFAYNLGTLAHTLYVQFQLETLGSADPGGPIQMIPAGAIGG